MACVGALRTFGAPAPLTLGVRLLVSADMLFLQTTQKARQVIGLGREVLSPPLQSNSRLGEWILNVVPMGGRYALLFMNVRSLISFPFLLGKLEPSMRDLPEFMGLGVTRLMDEMEIPAQQVEQLLAELDEVAVCKAVDKSLLGVFSAIASDYFFRIEQAGGLKKCDLSKIITDVNRAPRQTLGWRSSFEVCAELMAKSNSLA